MFHKYVLIIPFPYDCCVLLRDLRSFSLQYRCAFMIVFVVFQGVTWPAILPLAANWIPPNERSKFMANMMGKWHFMSSIRFSIIIIIIIFLIECSQSFHWTHVIFQLRMYTTAMSNTQNDFPRSNITWRRKKTT